MVTGILITSACVRLAFRLPAFHRFDLSPPAPKLNAGGFPLCDCFCLPNDSGSTTVSEHGFTPPMCFPLNAIAFGSAVVGLWLVRGLGADEIQRVR